ncbi:hypothetical protein J6590_053614 [Homalodisca vitripennis]|nr:hypothetical protein J6590_053614 [Homalodisca vitripennis]
MHHAQTSKRRPASESPAWIRQRILTGEQHFPNAADVELHSGRRKQSGVSAWRKAAEGGLRVDQPLEPLGPSMFPNRFICYPGEPRMVYREVSFLDISQRYNREISFLFCARGYRSRGIEIPLRLWFLIADR